MRECTCSLCCSRYRAKEAELKDRFDAELGEELGTYEKIVEERVPFWLPILRPEGAAPEHQNPLNFDSGLLVVEYMCGYDRNDDTKGLHAIMKDRTGGMSSKATRGIALSRRALARIVTIQVMRYKHRKRVNFGC